MTMTPQQSLLAAILNSQSEPEDAVAFTDERLREALTTGPGFTTEEKKLLWSSPDARDHFLTIREQVRLDLSEAVRKAGLGTSEMRLAASGSASEQEISGAGFIVSIFRDEAFGDEWSISVELSQEYLSLLAAGTTVSLQDTGGMVWARGKPDVHSRIGAQWTALDTPMQRLARFSLRLDP
jgi:hypothetical protein